MSGPTKTQELTALIVNYMGMTEVEKEKYYETVLTFSKQEKIEHSVRKILNALDNQELQKTREQLFKAEQRIFHLGECSSLWDYRGDCDCTVKELMKNCSNKSELNLAKENK